MVDTPTPDEARGRTADFHPETDAALLAEVRQALAARDAKISPEEHIWKVIGFRHSPEWAEAHQNLKAAEARLNEVMSPDNRPLGPIGQALDSEETVYVESQYNAALALATIFGEAVRQDPSLKIIYERVARNVDVLTMSEALSSKTRQAMEDSERLMPSSPGGLGIAFAKAFGFLGLKKTPPAGALLTPPPAPSSPET